MPQIPAEIMNFRPIMKNIENYTFVVEMRCKQQVLTEISLPLELWPEGWQLGGQYSLSQFTSLFR